MEAAVGQAGYTADDMNLGESAHADVSSSLPFRLAKELKKNPMEILEGHRLPHGQKRVHRPR